MTDPLSIVAVGASVLMTIGLASWIMLRGWQAWLDFKRLELAAHSGGEIAMPAAGGRIELADLKERVRKLEAIAAGIDL